MAAHKPFLISDYLSDPYSHQVYALFGHISPSCIGDTWSAGNCKDVAFYIPITSHTCLAVVLFLCFLMGVLFLPNDAMASHFPWGCLLSGGLSRTDRRMEGRHEILLCRASKAMYVLAWTKQHFEGCYPLGLTFIDASRRSLVNDNSSEVSGVHFGISRIDLGVILLDSSTSASSEFDFGSTILH
ncbi:hypothetical protein HD554DRAFT_388199 [Boletus coccyginus]|nr:hypothetical protein HD554DRAFT_388199 [Boletus coccyginus]